MILTHLLVCPCNDYNIFRRKYRACRLEENIKGNSEFEQLISVPSTLSTVLVYIKSEYQLKQSKNPYHLNVLQVVVQEGGTERDVVVGVVRGKHDVHRAAGDVRHTVGYHACNGLIVYCGASGKQTFEGIQA